MTNYELRIQIPSTVDHLKHAKVMTKFHELQQLAASIGGDVTMEPAPAAAPAAPVPAAPPGIEQPPAAPSAPKKTKAQQAADDALETARQQGATEPQLAVGRQAADGALAAKKRQAGVLEAIKTALAQAGFPPAAAPAPAAPAAPATVPPPAAPAAPAPAAPAAAPAAPAPVDLSTLTGTADATAAAAPLTQADVIQTLTTLNERHKQAGVQAALAVLQEHGVTTVMELTTPEQLQSVHARFLQVDAQLSQDQ